MKLRNLFYVLLLFVSVNISVTAQEWTNNLPPKNDSELTFYDYQNAFNEYWSQYDVVGGYYFDNDGVKNKAAGWKQFKRWEYYWEQRVDRITGAFPEINTQDMMDAYYNPPQGLPMGLGVANWTSLGPNASGGGYAGVGRLNCIAFHPSDNNTFWVGAAAGGLWKTTDGGSSWIVLNNSTGVLAVSDIIIPSDYDVSNTIYIATGDRDAFDNNSIGVLKSTDGGVTWNTTGLTYSVANGKMVSRLLLDPASDQTIVASTKDGVYKTTDGGTNWGAALTTERFLDIEYKPGDFNTLYGGTKYGGEVWMSNDGGATWSMTLNTSGSRVEIAVSANDPTVVYALSANSELVGVYKSTDSGATFTMVYDGSSSCQNLLGWNSDGCDSGGQGWYDLSFEANPSDANMIFVGGVNTWKSSDGGSSFSISNHWYGAGGLPAVHADKHKLRYRSNGDLFECNDGGVYISTNDGASWTDKTNGMIISQMYRIGVSQTVSTETQCGLQDNGTKLITGGVWSDVRGGDGMECIIDYTDVNIQYNTYVRGDIDRTTNHWANSTSIKPSGANGAWVTPYVMDPVDHNTLYAGYQHIYKSIDQGTTWSIIYNLNSSGRFRSLAVAPSNTQVIYAGESSTLWTTADGGGSWTDITTGLPSDFITYIAVKNDDANTVWVTLSTYSGNSVYQSIDQGANWTNISAGLPSVPVNSIVQNKLITGQNDLYVGTDNGVYYKAGAANWASFNTGLPNVDMAELEIYYDLTTPENSMLRGGSYGRGLWESPIIAPCENAVANINEFHYDNTGGDVGEFVEIYIVNPQPTDLNNYTVELYNGSNGSSYGSETLDNFTATIGTGGTYYVWLPSSMQNGSPDGLALAGPCGFMEFVSYEGAFTGVGGIANGETSTDVGVGETGSTPIGSSLQLINGVWVFTSGTNTMGAENSLPCFNAIANINEFHYDNASTDVGEFVEIFIADPQPMDLNNYIVELYNGSNGSSYGSETLDNFTATSVTGGTYYVWLPSSMQNGAPDGIALAGPCGFMEFVSYEGAFTAVGGIADGETSTDVGVAESGSTPIGSSLQLINGAWVFTSGTNTMGAENLLPMPCALTITQSDEGTCEDNGSSSDPMDDWFSITFNATVANGGVSDKYEVVLNANTDGTGGTVLNAGGTAFGTSVIVGDGTTPPFVADGATTYNITVRDIDDPTCHGDYTTTVVYSCSTGSITIDNNGGPTIADPCTCAGNGEFDEEVVVSSVTGEVWTVTANTGYLDPMTLTSFPINTPLIQNPADSGKYTLVGKHLDDQGYSITVSNGTTTLTIDNECWYPIAQIDNLPTTVCLTAAPITLMGSAILGDGSGTATAESEAWTGPGVVGNIFTPAMAGFGLHTITYTFDAADDNPNEHHPGCVDTKVQHLFVGDLMPPVFDIQLACDTIACEGLLTDIPTATDNCSGPVVVTEEAPEIIADYTCAGNFLIYGAQETVLPYSLYSDATPLAPQFVMDLNNLNGIGYSCDPISGAHLYGMWQDPSDVASLTNSPDVYFVDINPYSGKTAIIGTIPAPPLLTAGANEVAASYAMSSIGDAGTDAFYMTGVSILMNTLNNTIVDFKLYKGTINLNTCPPKGNPVSVAYQEMNLDQLCSAYLSNFANDLTAFLNGTSGDPSGGIKDWALSPDGLTLYAFMGVENSLMTVDVATSVAVCVPGDYMNAMNGFVGSTGALTDEFGGMYFDAAGVLHGYQADRGRIFSISIPFGTLTLVDGTLPPDQRGDAASCSDCQVLTSTCPIVSRTKRIFKAEDMFGNVNYQYQNVLEIDTTTVSLNDPADECVNGNDMIFTGVPTDANGVFTTNAAAGLTDNGDGTAVLDVSVAGEGTHKVYYTYNLNGTCCPKTDSVEVVVLDTPDEPIVSDITVCEGESTEIIPQSTAGSGGGGACLASTDLVISGVVDGPLPGGVPKAVEFYVVNDIPDLSVYGFGSANNGGGTDGEEFTFPADAVMAGTYIYVSYLSNTTPTAFVDYFGFAPTYETNGQAPNINGDDAIELFHNGAVIDVFGDIDTDGTGQPWEYLDGWAYRINDTGEDGTTFVLGNWIFSGPNALDGSTTNATSNAPFPLGIYTCTLPTNPPLFNFYSDAGLTNLLAGPTTSYDPMTTTTNSPQSIWVTELNTTTGCESDPVEVVITVYSQPEAEAGDNQMFCDVPASVSISATANYTGIWTTSGAGTIANPTSPSTTYLPISSDVGTTVVMVWTTDAPAGVGCIAASDSMGITIVSPTEDAEFSYPLDEYCPDGGNPTVTHVTGIDGIYTYEVVSDGPNLVIDNHTGEINMLASDPGTYDVTNTVDGRGNLIITGVIDGPISGGLPKAIEVYALQDISDLSRYGLESANNNNASNGTPEFVFPDDAVAAGTYIWIASESTQFSNFFGVAPNYTGNVANINGDDAILLYNDGQVIDVFGEDGFNNNINDWTYQDGWAYRLDNTGPDGTVFKVANWEYSGVNALDNETSNATAAIPFPMASFATTYQGTCDANTHTDRVVVGDLIVPVIDCPQDWNVYLDPGDCSIFFHYDYPEASDNCDPDPIVTLISGPDTGDEFTLLNSPYTMEFVATDIYGNASEVCVFEIAIHGYPNAVEGLLACNDEIQVSLDENCEIQMNADNFLEGGPYQCYNMFQVYVNDPFYENENVSNLNINLEPGTYMVTVADEAAIGNSCMTTMVVVDKIGPVIECNCPTGSTEPECVILGCYDPDGSYVFALPTVSDNCGEPELLLISKEVVDNGVCGSETVVLTWEVSDPSGNTATCTEEYIFQGADITLLSYPNNYDDLPFNEPMLECSEDWYLYDAQGNRYDYPHPDQTGYPTGYGEFCNTMEIFYTDDVKNLDCGEKILRKWAVVDDCTGLVYAHTQVIRITDNTAPTFMEMDDIFANTKGYICNSDIKVPTIMHLEDNCYSAPKWWFTTDMGFEIAGDINGNGFVDINETWTVLDVPNGTYDMCYHAIDICGNESIQCIKVTVEDKNQPIPVCEQFKQVSITAMGSGRVFAHDFDSGSFDNCNPVYFKVLRVDSNLVYDGGCENLNGDDNPFTSPVDVWYDENVFFCCEDVDADVMVSMRVFEVDPGNGPVNPKRMEIGGDLYGHYNDCWSIVYVECKIPPALDCPDVTVTCEESLDPIENPRLMPNIISVCGFETEYSDKRDMGICGANIIRTWTATGCEKATQCKQKITIESTEPFDPCTIKFPKDEKADCSAALPADKQPTWDEYPCNVVTAEVIHEDTFRFVDGACYKIVREWAVVDWCVYEENTGAEDNVDVISGTKLNCAQLVNDGFYRYTQILIVTDFIPPTIEVEEACIAYTDGCYATGTTLTASATDSCNVDEKFNWKYLVVNMDTWDTIQYSYNYTPKPQTGKAGKRSKDNLDRTGEASLEILDAIPGGTYRVQWTVGDGCGNANTTPQYFEVRDKKAPTPIMVDIATALMTNCMVEICAITFDKGGCEGSCISSYDNCTEKSELYFTFSPVIPQLNVEPLKWQKQFAKYGKYFYDPVSGLISTEEKYLFGEAFAWNPDLKTSCRIYGLDREGNAPDLTQRVEVYVWDQFAMNETCDDNNYDFAYVILALNNEGDDCPPIGSLVSGMVSNCAVEAPINGVNISFNNGEDVKHTLNQENGTYQTSLEDDEYTVTASKQTEGLNGITTLDIVLIQKHILGIKNIEDVCSYAAMDANSDGRVSASDILAIRKMILGSSEHIVNWNFMDEEYLENYPDISYFSLKDAYSKTITMSNGSTLNNTNFKGVYAGDVNNSGDHIESRSDNSIELVMDDVILEEGNIVEIPVFAREFANIFGAQFSINITGLEISEIIPGAIVLRPNNYNVVDNNFVMSWDSPSKVSIEDNEILFTIVAKSNIDGLLSDIISVNDEIARAEAYIGSELEISELTLKVRNSDFEYTLYQNQPNPFSEKTMIGFDLPIENVYTLSIFDVTGKLIKEFTEIGKSGYNSITVDKNEIRLSGVLYYQLKSGDYTNTKKMIILK